MTTRFAEFTFDPERHELSRGSAIIPIPPKAFVLLGLLLNERPRAVSKEEILESVWPDVIVEEENIKNLVAEIRHALEDDPKDPTFIRTVHRHGYAFIAEAWEESSNRREAPSRLLVDENGRTWPISIGENIIGRDPSAGIRIDFPGASRRHAKITARASETIVEDLGSKNGTWLNGARLEEGALLEDGDEIRIGRVSLMFRSESDPTVTLEESE